MMEDDSDASPACLAHRLVDGHPVDLNTARDVSRFRRAERARLMEARRRISLIDRAAMNDMLVRALDELMTPRPGLRIAAYWPIRGEPDLRGWMARAHTAGATILLPVVVEKDAPLAFRAWSPGCAMERGIWHIPVPRDGSEMRPDVVISPLVGVDEGCFRLGNGGGYYDRTLARLEPLPQIIGIGWPDCAIPTIFPMPWDVPMDHVLLADGSIRHRT
ncbi:5-formyltetrahydrofolate cyclo-ligase [uncultured Jannaschia sp.]|uniref:5-formyltetrahydrofolate cyclo-ligase n=1 Tax=uncultured Jannaschia sp. TaxID=293347 RepID=UPI0026194ACF|nr:5-formyltetrahydrofolate cyclo-ligase [uncultured Jannaschia sp.]